MTSWLAALTGIITLLLLAFSTFLTALLLLTTILLMMPHPVVAGPVSIPLFSVCSFASPTKHFPWEKKTHSKVVKFPRRLKAEECRLLALRTDNIHHLAVLEQIATLWLQMAKDIDRRS